MLRIECNFLGGTIPIMSEIFVLPLLKNNEMIEDKEAGRLETILRQSAVGTEEI